mgnify:CR=1 FL=1
MLRVRDAAAGFAAEHVAGHVAAVDVHARTQEGEQQAPGATAGVQRRFPTPLDGIPEESDVVSADFELRPPERDRSVVPGVDALAHT